MTVFDAAGNPAGSQEFSQDSAGVQQFALGAFAEAVAVGRAHLVVTRGHAAGYAVVVDNVTGDSSLFAFEDSPAGRQDVLVNGVARANGRNGTFFRTDARIYNPTSSVATVAAAFHANQSANPGPASATFTVGAGQILDVVDVLQTLLGLPVGSAGALRFTSDAPVAILCRTSNVDPAGVRPGTYGAQQKPVPMFSFLTSADAGAVVTAVRQNTSFRTNVGLAAGADGASYTLTLRNAAGTAVASASGALGVYGWTQPNVQDLFQNVSVPEDATLLVSVTAGTLDVFDSSIDNASGDPVVTPVMPLPAAIASSATIGPQGGSIRSADGRLTLLVPAGALSAPTPVAIATDASDAPGGVGPAYVLSPAGLSFARPLIARLAYGPDDTAGSGAAGLAIAFRQPDGWYAVTGGLVDTGRRTVSVILPSGTPSPANLRTAMDVAGWSQRLAILQAWEIVPKSASLLGGGTTDFKAYYSGPPSSARCLTPFCAEKTTPPYPVNVDWFVGGLRGGTPSTGTVSPGTGMTTTYTAPCAYPVPLDVSFRISDPRLPGAKEEPEQMARVSVFSRGKWQVTVDQRNSEACPSGGELWGWTSTVVLRFSFRDGGGPVIGLTKVGGSDTMSVISPCQDFIGCTLTPDPIWPGLTVNAVSGTLVPGGVSFGIDMTEMAASQTTVVACPSGSYTLPMVLGPQISFGPDVLGPAGGERRIEIPGDNRAYLRYSLEPLPNCGN